MRRDTYKEAVSNVERAAKATEPPFPIGVVAGDWLEAHHMFTSHA